MKIIARLQDDSQMYLVTAPIPQGKTTAWAQILDYKRKKLYPPNNLASFLARSIWIPYTGDQSILSDLHIDQDTSPEGVPTA